MVTETTRADIRACKSEGLSRSATLKWLVKRYHLYHGYVDSEFVRNKETLEKAVNEVYTED